MRLLKANNSGGDSPSTSAPNGRVVAEGRQMSRDLAPLARDANSRASKSDRNVHPSDGRFSPTSNGTPMASQRLNG
jgi:hypothetical protein